MKANRGTCNSQKPVSQHDCKSKQDMLTLNELREKDPLCDALLCLDDGGTLPVHSVILSMCSTYFRFVWLLIWLTEDRKQ
jgi:hypothetical protein